MIRGGIVTAWSSSGQTSHRFCSSLAMTMANLGPMCCDRIDAESGPLMATTRNNMVRTFLAETEGERLLFLDADMEWDWAAVRKMLDVYDPQQTPILGGLCFGGGRGGLIFPTLYGCVRDEQGGLNLERINEYPKDALVKVDATGGAFIMIERWVFERMYEAFGVVRDEESEILLRNGIPVEHPYPWFTYGANNGKSTGEDIAFCLRARALDIPVHVHTGIRIGHVKTMILDEAMFEETKAKQAAEQATAKRVNGTLHGPIHQGRTTVSKRKQLRV